MVLEFIIKRMILCMKVTHLFNELIYYYDKEYRDPWYMDNVGSFLIVIERKTNK